MIGPTTGSCGWSFRTPGHGSLDAGQESVAERGNAVPIMINGREVPAPGDARISLLDFVREDLELYGTKKGCNQGACGACTVLVDGERILSCLALAVQFDGREVTTIEGLATDGVLHPLQQAFIDHDGFQCGYCTPGQICSAVGMADEVARGVPSHVTDDLGATEIALDHDELRERMSGNLCRCGAHNGIVDAIAEVYAGSGA
jgi:xanthine dehydrogenase YagT iron-sulfur-binding subunit